MKKQHYNYINKKSGLMLMRRATAAV